MNSYRWIIHQDNKMEARSIQPDDYVLLTSAGKSQTYLIKNIAPEGIYISPLTDPSQKILLTFTDEKWEVKGSFFDYNIEFSSKENPPLIFTNVPELDIQILNNLSDDALKYACQTDKYTASLCRKDELWERRIGKYFPGTEKPEDTSWKDYYFTLKQEAEKLYVAMYNNSADAEMDLIGMYKKKESAAKSIFGDFIEVLTPDETIDEAGVPHFFTPEGNFTETEFIQHIIDRGSITVEHNLSYQIFEYDEKNIKP